MMETIAMDFEQETEATKLPLRRYPAYKDSGVEWLGEIPEHWHLVSLGSLLELKSDKNNPDFEVLSVYREYGVIPKDSRDDNHNATSLDTSTYKTVEPGDLVVNKMKAWQGSMGITKYKGIVSPAYITCRVTSAKVDVDYFHQLLRSNSYIGEYNRISYGVRIGQWDMHFEDFKRIPIALPPKSEQTRIAQFLDRKIAQIDKAVGQKERLIELLKEQRQLIINTAVIHGLNPHVKMKDSGVKWIGEIPEHWEIRKLGSILELKSDKNHPELEVLSVYREYGVIPKDSRDDNHNVTSLDKTMYKAVEPGDLVVNKMKAWQGSMGISKYKGIVSPAYITCKVQKQKFESDYLHLLLRVHSYIGEYNRLSYGVRIGQWDMHYEDLKKIPLVVPPRSEQQAISQFIEKITAKIQTAISLKQREIEKLKEYKATLIDSAVTGKIRV